MNKYVRVLKTELQKLYTLVKGQREYIKKLELALESVKRQLANIKEAKDAET